MDHPVTVTNATFEDEVIKSDKPVMVDFWAPWCGPCKMLAPVLEELARENPQYKVCKVNVDEETALAAKFNVISIPTVLVFKNGVKTGQSVGFSSKEKLLKLF